MKDILGWIAKIIGLIFAVLVIGFTSWLTYLLAARLIPDSPILQAMTVILFDGGALTWFFLFLTQARGTAQWGIAGIGFAVGLIGAVIMAGGELILGQQLIVLDDSTRIGWLLITTVIVAALAHASLTYAFHFSSPEVKNRIENEQRVSKVIEAAYKDARAEIDRQSQSMGAEVAESLLYEARAQISAAALPHLRRGATLESRTAEQLRGGLVIESKPHTLAGVRLPWKDKQAVELRQYAADSKAVTGDPLPVNRNGSGSDPQGAEQ